MRLLNLHPSLLALSVALPLAAQSPSPVFHPVPSFPLTHEGLVIARPVQPTQPFTVAGPRGVLVGTQDGSFESWILPVKLISHLTIEAGIEGYTVPIPVNDHAANIEVRPGHTTITYSHPGFTLRQIMFSPDEVQRPDGSREAAPPRSGPIVLFQIDALKPTDFIFRFTPEMRWMWPRRNDGIPGPNWVENRPTSTEGVPQVSTLRPGSDAPVPGGYYTLHMDYPDLAGAITIPGATPGIMAPYQERPQVHPLELHLHYDPKRDGDKFFPLLMAVGTTRETATNEALGESLQSLNNNIASSYAAQARHYKDLLANSTSIETPDKRLNEAFQWAVVSIEQLRTLAYPGPASPPGITSPETALVAGYYQSADSARPGFGWFFGRDALYTLYAVNGFGDFALTRSELEFLIHRQRADGKIMHEYSQTANDPTVDWPQFPYMYAAADATPLFLMAVRDYYRASGDLDFLKAHREAIEKAWAFETHTAHDTDHDGIYDNSQGTGWVESWPGAMPHQEIYLALLDEQASTAYAALEAALGESGNADSATSRAAQVKARIEQEYYDQQKGCYAFATNPAGTPNSPVDHTRTVYPAIAYWDYISPTPSQSYSAKVGGGFNPRTNGRDKRGAGRDGLQPIHSSPEASLSPLAHPEACLTNWAGPTLDTDWGLRDVAADEPYYDGMSYHQGSVWPLFTGWAALAEYRANQPLAGEQLLMQNVNLTWAQDPGSVTELLSGDYFIPFGRSTSHQLWSSAMTLTPILRGLFGISLDAPTDTITVNPHMPAEWTSAKVNNLRLGNRTITLNLEHYSATHIRPGSVAVSAQIDKAEKSGHIQLRSDQLGSVPSSNQSPDIAEITIPPPPVEIELPAQALPEPGARTAQFKILGTHYSDHRLRLLVSAPAGTTTELNLRLNQSLPSLRIDETSPAQAQAAVELRTMRSQSRSSPLSEGSRLSIHFPQGQGWQTLEFTLTW